MRIRPSGPLNVVRPSNPAIGLTEPADQIGDALDRIAVTLAAIDHNIEVFTGRIQVMADNLQSIQNAMSRR